VLPVFGRAIGSAQGPNEHVVAACMVLSLSLARLKVSPFWSGEIAIVRY
jgi:hypothetical protein